MGCVYGLYAGSNSDDVRYIGCTKNGDAQKRLREHIKNSTEADTKRNSWPIYNWIRKETSAGNSINYLVLGYFDSWEATLSAEVDFIKEYRQGGFKLLNVTDGGEGYGLKHSEETKRLNRDIAIRNHKKIKESGLVWGVDVGPKPYSEPQVISLISDMRKSGATYRMIAGHLNSEKIPTSRGANWHPTTVKNMCDRLSLN
jgi:hypothetical protein